MSAHSLQGYLKEFNELLEEFRGKNVGIFGVCAQPQELVDKAVREWELNFTVSERGERKDED